MLNVPQNRGNHRSDLLDVINVLTNLGEGHDASVLVSPVSVVSDSVLNENTNQGEHDGLTDTCDKSVDSLLAEADVVLFLILTSESFLWLEPVSLNVLIDINHELEDKFKDILDHGLVLLCKGWLSLDHGDDELERLMSNRIISKFFVRDNWLKSLVEGLEISAEEVWLNLSKFVELNKSILEHGFILLVEGLGHDSGHEGQKLDELLSVLALGDGQVVGESLESSDLNVQILELESSLEDASELVLVLYEMVKDVTEESVEDDESGVNLCLVLTLNELEESVQQFLPDAIILLGNHSALDFNCDITNFMDQSLVGSIDTLQGLKNRALDSLTSGISQALPQVGVVVLVGQILCIGRLSADVSAENDSGEALGLD